jgi:hypothetical protein
MWENRGTINSFNTILIPLRLNSMRIFYDRLVNNTQSLNPLEFKFQLVSISYHKFIHERTAHRSHQARKELRYRTNNTGRYCVANKSTAFHSHSLML